jgi:hypothetical protein
VLLSKENHLHCWPTVVGVYSGPDLRLTDLVTWISSGRTMRELGRVGHNTIKILLLSESSSPIVGYASAENIG